MPISYAELKAMLDVDEPDYPALAEMAAGAIQHLRRLAASADVSVASKAVSLAGIMGNTDIVGDASKSRDVLVRVAAAHGASLLPDTPQAARVVSKLLGDRDVGVVKFAARAATRLSDPGVAAKARRASKRMHATARAIAAQQSRLERSTAMAKKAGATRAKATRKGGTKAAAGGMPSGAMTKPPKGAKGRQFCWDVSRRIAQLPGSFMGQPFRSTAIARRARPG
jgi:hypothetical protein